MKSLKRLIRAATARISSRGWLLLVVGILILVYPLPVQSGQPAERLFRIEASQFAYTPSILKVNQGDRVTLELVSTDVVHGLTIDGYDQQITSDPGQSARLTFTADRAGSYRFRCTATCGSLHPFMIGKIQVGQNSLLWRGVSLSLLGVAVVLWRRFS